MIVQLWGPVFDLVGDGGFKAFTFSWFTLKYGNVIEMILVVLIFVAGMFINLPGGKAETPKAPAMTGPADASRTLAVRGVR